MMYSKKKVLAAAVAVSVMMVFGIGHAFAASEVLRKEAQGSAVTNLQNDLKRLGYLSVDATGYFGDMTEAAVKEVQKEYGYEADGIVGSITFSLVNRLLGRSSTVAATKTAAAATAATATKPTTAATTIASTANVKSLTLQDAVGAKLLKKGDENSFVKILQSSLIKLGYLDTNATGYYGPATEAAVKNLQKKHGYTSDGIAGSATLGLLSKLESGDKASLAVKAMTEKTATEATTAATATAATATTATTAATDGEKTAEKTAEKTTQTNFLLPWFGSVEKTFGRGDTATVYDIETGLSFNIKRTYGHNHADCEALTAKDTAIMKKIYNGAWSWERRAIIVSVDGLKIAACMTGMPHAGLDKYTANKTVSSRSGGFGRGTNLDAVKGNNMNGVFDIHFLGSKNHYNNKIDPKHQVLVKAANKWAKENYK